MKADWQALLQAEAAHALHPASCNVVSLMRWRHFKAVRMLFMLAEAHGWQVTPELQNFIKDMFRGFPDTKVIEDTHQHLRDLGRDNRNFIISRVKRMYSCMESGELEKRHTKVVPTVDRELLKKSWYMLSKTKLRSLTQTRGLKLKDHSLQMIMHPKTQASTNPEGLFGMAGATEWAFHFWQLPVDCDFSMEQAWQSVLLVRFDIVRHILSQKTLMVIAVSDYAFQAWTMRDLPGQQAWTMQEAMLQMYELT